MSDHDHDHDHDHLHEHEHEHGQLARLVGGLVGHSHDPGDSIDDALTSDARGIRALKLSLLGLGITAVLQLAVVLISGSVALLADTIHNFSDALTAIPLWIAFVLGARAATRRYTFGYRRVPKSLPPGLLREGGLAQRDSPERTALVALGIRPAQGCLLG